jgi:hypothetical protein
MTNDELMTKRERELIAIEHSVGRDSVEPFWEGALFGSTESRPTKAYS